MDLLTAPSKSSQVASHLRNMIKKNNFKPGARLSATRQLAAEFNVSQKTVKCALDILSAERLIRCEHGRGIFIEPQAATGDTEVYVLLWGMRREPCEYYEEILNIAYPPALKDGYSFTLRTVFKDSDDFAHFDQELARIENSPQIKCLLTPSTHYNVELFDKLSRLHCPVVYFGDSKYEEAVDYPRNRIIDASDWSDAAIAFLNNANAREFTFFVPDSSIAFFKESTRKIVMKASQTGIKVNLSTIPCSLYNETDPEKIAHTYQRIIRSAIRNGELDKPIVMHGMIKSIFMELPEIKERLASGVPFLEPQWAHSHMQEFFSSTFELMDAAIRAPADIHIKKIYPPVRLHDFATSTDYLFDGTKQIT